jgi:hypothetical protein
MHLSQIDSLSPPIRNTMIGLSKPFRSFCFPLPCSIFPPLYTLSFPTSIFSLFFPFPIYPFFFPFLVTVLSHFHIHGPSNPQIVSLSFSSIHLCISLPRHLEFSLIHRYVDSNIFLHFLKPSHCTSTSSFYISTIT